MTSSDAKETVLGSIRASEPERRGDAATFAYLFPAPHPYAVAGAKIRGRIRAVSGRDVIAFRNANLSADNLLVVATGAVDSDSLVKTLSLALAKVPRKATVCVPVIPARSACEGAAVVLDDAGSRQSTIRVSWPAVSASHADVPALQVLAAAAGGSLSARLDTVLRHANGLGYGFRARLEAMREGGVFSVHGDVDPKRTGLLLRTLNDAIENLARMPLSDDELLLAKIRASHSTARDDGAWSARGIAHAAILGIPAANTESIHAVTAEQVRAAAERYLRSSTRYIVAVGNANQLEADLRSAGVGPVARAAEGF